MPDGGLSTIAAITSIAGGIKGLMSGGGGSQSGTAAQAAADPFSSHRQGLGDLYSAALQPGASQDPTQMPGYSQFKTGVLDPAMTASKRSAAGSGMLYSGNEQQALQKVGQQGYYGFMTDYLNRLAQGSGAVNNPAGAAGLGAQVNQQNQQGFMQGLGGVSTGIGALYGGSSATTSQPTGSYYSTAQPAMGGDYVGGMSTTAY